MASTFPYMIKTTTISEFLRKVQDTGTPAKVDREYLNSIGLASSNDRPIIPLFRFLGFISSSGSPTDVYQAYRDKSKAKVVLGRAIKSAYSGLFATYRDADKRDDDALANYFRAKTSLGERAIGAVVATFKTLSASASFEDREETEDLEPTHPRKARAVAARDELAVDSLSSLTISIQLQLPATEDETVYDKLFSSLRRNLLERTKEK